MCCFLFKEEEGKKKRYVLSYELQLNERIFLRENAALGRTSYGGHNLENSPREVAVN